METTSPKGGYIIPTFEHYGRAERRGIEHQMGRAKLRATYGNDFVHLRCACPMCFANSLNLNPRNLEGLTFNA